MKLTDKVSIVCPKCGNEEGFRMGTMVIKAGMLKIASVECLRCGTKDEGEAFETEMRSK